MFLLIFIRNIKQQQTSKQLKQQDRFIKKNIKPFDFQLAIKNLEPSSRQEWKEEKARC